MNDLCYNTVYGVLDHPATYHNNIRGIAMTNHKFITIPYRANDITGQVFGRLTAIGPSGTLKP